jgi:hypothetical protein
MSDGKNDWTELADWINDTIHEAHRGVIRRGGKLVVFGNDGYHAEAVQREVELMRQWLAANGFTVEDFATDADRYTWLLVVARPDRPHLIEAMEAALWSCWAQAKGFDPALNDVQQRIATGVTDRVRDQGDDQGV